jgi:hypothetical protein
VIGLPAKLISAKAVLYLSGCLLLSLAGNAWLLQRWWTADARCTANTAVAANSTIVKAEAAEDERDLVSSEITRETDEQTEAALDAGRTATQADQEAVSDAYRNHPTAPPSDRSAVAAVCVHDPVAGVQERFDAARDRANAAAR